MSYPFLGLSIATVIAVGSLNDCGGLMRYQSEIYECLEAGAPFERLTFTKITLGKNGAVSGAMPPKATITFAGKTVFSANWGNSKLSVNRESGAVTVIKNGILRTHACKVMKFQM
jgi:hypothetical protein